MRIFPYLSIALLAISAAAQETSVFVSGLQLPYKVTITPAGSLLVSEGGAGINNGRISMISRSGARQSLIEGLPAALSNPDLTLIGPTGLAYRNRILYIVLAEGDGVRNAATAGLPIVANPAGVSSPLFASVLRVRFDADVDGLQSTFTLTRAQHNTVADGLEVTLTNAQSRTAIVDLLTKFPTLEPDAATVYRHHDPFALALDPLRPDALYLAEAGQNAVYRINVDTGRFQVLARMAPTPNPTPVGPPVVDAVPTSVLALGDQVLVTNLSGFPFVPGQATVKAVNVGTREVTPWINGLTSAIDIAYRVTTGGQYQFFVLGFSANQRAVPRSPGQLWRFTSPVGSVIVSTLETPTGMVVDPSTGDVFVVESTANRITRVKVP